MPYITISERMQIPSDPSEVKMGRVEFDLDKCSSCTYCAQCCPGSAIEMFRKKPRMVNIVPVPCMACGDCVAICPDDAVILVEPVKFDGFFKYIRRGPLEEPRLYKEKS